MIKNKKMAREIKLRNHRGCEGELGLEQDMCAFEFGLKPPSEWNESDWEIFYHWQNVLHSHDIVSGPNSREIEREKRRLGEESEKWLKEHLKNEKDIIFRP